MDPQLGRFITADPTIQNPTDPQNFNRYAYCRNNPIRFTDPTGLNIFDKIVNFGKKVIKAFVNSIGAFIGGTIGAIGGAAIGGTIGFFIGGPPGAVIGAHIGAYIGGSIGAGAGNAIQHGTNVLEGAWDGLVGGIEAAPFIAAGFAIGGPVGAAYAAVAYNVGRTYIETGSFEDALVAGTVSAGYAAISYKAYKATEQIMNKGLDVLSNKPLSNPNADIKFSPGAFNPEGAGAKAPDFVVMPSGQAIPIPDGARGPFPTNASGFMYTGGAGGKGLSIRVATVRIMDANKYQGQRVIYMNSAEPRGQIVDPYTGRTVANSDPRGHRRLDS